MSKNNVRSNQGFTIIEVVLVLAIAALILLIVFLAVPALQRNQRDTQRRSDLGRLQTAITNYASNHQGQLPTGAALTGFTSNVMRANGDKFADPKGGDYSLSTAKALNAGFGEYTEGSSVIFYKSGAKCGQNASGQNAFVSAGARSFAVAILLEGSADGFCQNS